MSRFLFLLSILFAVNFAVEASVAKLESSVQCLSGVIEFQDEHRDTTGSDGSDRDEGDLVFLQAVIASVFHTRHNKFFPTARALRSGVRATDQIRAPPLSFV